MTLSAGTTIPHSASLGVVNGNTSIGVVTITNLRNQTPTKQANSILHYKPPASSDSFYPLTTNYNKPTRRNNRGHPSLIYGKVNNTFRNLPSYGNSNNIPFQAPAEKSPQFLGVNGAYCSPAPVQNPLVTAGSTTTAMPAWSSLFKALPRNAGRYKSVHFDLSYKGAPLQLPDVRQAGIDKWQSHLVGFFLDEKLSFTVVATHLERLSKIKGTYRIQSDNTNFYFEFTDEDDKQKILEADPIFIRGKMFIIKWNPSFASAKEQVRSVPIWVHFRNIPFITWSMLGINWLACHLGRLVCYNEQTEKLEKLDYARCLVEILADCIPPDYIMCGDVDDQIRVSIGYDWLPLICTKCKVFGHTFETCIAAESRSFAIPLNANANKPGMVNMVPPVMLHKNPSFHAKHLQRKRKSWATKGDTNGKVHTEQMTSEVRHICTTENNSHGNLEKQHHQVSGSDVVFSAALSGMHAAVQPSSTLNSMHFPTDSSVVALQNSLCDGPRVVVELQNSLESQYGLTSQDVGDAAVLLQQCTSDTTQVINVNESINMKDMLSGPALVSEQILPSQLESTVVHECMGKTLETDSMKPSNSFSVHVDVGIDKKKNGDSAVDMAEASAELTSPCLNVTLPKHIVANLQLKQFDVEQVSIPPCTKESGHVVLPATTVQDETKTHSKKEKRKKVKKEKGKKEKSKYDDNDHITPMNSESEEDLDVCIPSFITNAYAKATTSSSSEGVRWLSARQRKIHTKMRVWKR